jgi:hypothetical protein
MPRAAAVVVAALLAACATEPARPPPTGAREPPGFPVARYEALAKQGRPVLRIDPGRSVIVIEVHRAGSLAHLGHDHVVASHDANGYIAPDEGRADIYAALDTLVVDEADLRNAAGFETHPTAGDIAATRRNMLDKVLESERFPFVLVAVDGAAARQAQQTLPVTVALHGITRRVDALVDVQRSGDNISVAGSFSIDQSQFGIVPYSILGGAVAVQDRVDIRFRLVAHAVR